MVGGSGKASRCNEPSKQLAALLATGATAAPKTGCRYALAAFWITIFVGGKLVFATLAEGGRNPVREVAEGSLIGNATVNKAPVGVSRGVHSAFTQL